MKKYTYPLDAKAPVNQRFGANAQVYKNFGVQGHTGVDLGVFEGTPIYATADGVVAFAGEGRENEIMKSGAGRCVLIDHGDLYSGYAHLVKWLVETDEEVVQGQLIGLSGLTGATTGPHLHFEFIRKPVDLLDGWFSRIDPEVLGVDLDDPFSTDVEPISSSDIEDQGRTSD